ncbi:LysR substrate-binding domain-containing protein [Bordetella sp. N]|uniref:LysR substrate-binding domain-containing protein n=1 Tax=Bordetella sp. N TaxID=1746199 RepID=UPI00070FE4AE|nr:LysR substrate-binding domain-containing protein [Bordetella sp. N]ALM81749.1 LysR family transcriptional regulator [Bordetella sp. N]
MPRLPLNTLPTFRVVAELQNLRAAAEALHLTHSAVSQQLRVLETQLGHPVFDRHGRRLSLNAAGAALLPYVKEALAQLDAGMQAAATAAGSTGQRLRLSVLPSFAQRWLLPRMGRWREQHPDIALEIESSQQLVDVRREGFHAALRQGRGPWPGLNSEKLFDHPMPMILVGSATAARRLAGATPADYAREPLLGEVSLWEQWFDAAGAPRKVSTVAVFNDAGLLLSAVEQGLGLAVVRELLAADALRDGRLVRLSPVEILYDPANAYQLVYPSALQDWPPLIILVEWIREELEASRRALQYAAPGTRRASREQPRKDHGGA